MLKKFKCSIYIIFLFLNSNLLHSEDCNITEIKITEEPKKLDLDFAKILKKMPVEPSPAKQLVNTGEIKENKSYWRWYNTGILLAGIALTYGRKKCINGPWVSTHKTLHMGGNALVTGILDTTLTSELLSEKLKSNYEPAMAVAVGEVISFTREIYKVNHSDMACEWASMTWDAAGIAIGMAISSKLLISKTNDGFRLVYKTSFN